MGLARGFWSSRAPRLAIGAPSVPSVSPSPWDRRRPSPNPKSRCRRLWLPGLLLRRHKGPSSPLLFLSSLTTLQITSSGSHLPSPSAMYFSNAFEKYTRCEMILPSDSLTTLQITSSGSQPHRDLNCRYHPRCIFRMHSKNIHVARRPFPPTQIHTYLPHYGFVIRQLHIVIRYSLSGDRRASPGDTTLTTRSTGQSVTARIKVS